MYAVIEDKGRQFKVAEGDHIAVDLRDAKPGDMIEFDRVLLCSGNDGPQVGAPYLQTVKVRAEVEEQIKARKVISYKYRKRKNSSRKIGHRQRYLRVRIKEIVTQDTTAECAEKS